jgi:hypothetical protein
MKRLSLIPWCFFIGIGFALDVSAKEWRGIVPLHSTRADVVRQFGCDPGQGCKVRVGNEEAYFVFSSDTGEAIKCAKDLPPNTVLLIEVQLINPPKLSAFRINKNQFRTFDPSTPPHTGYKGYIDEKEGMIIKTYKGKVLQVDYIAAGKDVALCPDYYEDPESFIQLFIEHCCPTVYVDCPRQAPIDGERITLSASTGAGGRLRFNWRVSAGKIVAGQGTMKITVDTTGAGGRTITETIEMDYGNGHLTATYCEFPVSVHREN